MRGRLVLRQIDSNGKITRHLQLFHSQLESVGRHARNKGVPTKPHVGRYGKRVKLEGDELRALAAGLRTSYESALNAGEI